MATKITISALLLTCFVHALSAAPFSLDKCRTDITINTIGKETLYNFEELLRKAEKNRHFVLANTKLQSEKVSRKFDHKEVETIDFEGIVSELEAAASEGDVLSAWQGYQLTSYLTGKHGRWAKAILPKFGEYLVKANICQGFIDMADMYGMGWVTGVYAPKKALEVIKQGQDVCYAKGISWQIEGWQLMHYKYKAIVEHPEKMVRKPKK